MVTHKELLDELLEMKKDADIETGEIWFWYRDIETFMDVRWMELFEQAGLTSGSISCVGNSRFGRFLYIKGTSKSGRQINVYCSDKFKERIE
jgi:hypothetical protein